MRAALTHEIDVRRGIVGNVHVMMVEAESFSEKPVRRLKNRNCYRDIPKATQLVVGGNAAVFPWMCGARTTVVDEAQPRAHGIIEIERCSFVPVQNPRMRDTKRVQALHPVIESRLAVHSKRRVSYRIVATALRRSARYVEDGN